MERVCIAFSGGVDSTFLTCFASNVIGTANVTAVTAVAPNFADDEINYAQTLASHLGIRHICVKAELPNIFFQNPPDRCYHCKKAIFSQLMNTSCAVLSEADDTISDSIAVSRSIIFCDGKNKDDDADYRPGSIAAKELGVRSPLHEAGLTKAEIRETLKEMGIEIWNKPAFACLASRIPYNTEITEAKLRAIYDIELLLKQNGFTQVRARLHDDIVRLELPQSEIPELASDRSLCDNLTSLARKHGFKFITIDLAGYRMGSLNSAITK